MSSINIVNSHVNNPLCPNEDEFNNVNEFYFDYDSDMNEIFLEESFCVHQNIRSLRKNFDNFLVHIESLVKLPLVIILSEVWIYQNKLSNYNINGYTLYGNCNESFSAGGIVVFVKNDLLCDCNKIESTSADILSIHLLLNNNWFTLICIYRLQFITNNIFLDELENILKVKKDKNLIVLGDINIDLLDKCDKYADNYSLLMASFGLKSVINEPTRITDTSASCIDHMFVRFHKNNKSVFKCYVSDYKITDHHFCALYMCKHSSDNQILITRKEKVRTDFCILREKLRYKFWEEIYFECDPTKSFYLFKSVLDKHIKDSSQFVSFRHTKKC